MEYSENDQQVLCHCVLPKHEKTSDGFPQILSENDVLYELIDSSGTPYTTIFCFLNQETGALKFIGHVAQTRKDGVGQNVLLLETAESLINVNAPISFLYFNKNIIKNEKNVFCELRAGKGINIYQFFVQNNEGRLQLLDSVTFQTTLRSSCGQSISVENGFDPQMLPHLDEFLRIFQYGEQPHLLFYKHATQQIYALSFVMIDGQCNYQISFCTNTDFASAEEIKNACFVSSETTGNHALLFRDAGKTELHLASVSQNSGFLKMRRTAIGQEVHTGLSYQELIHGQDFYMTNAMLTFQTQQTHHVEMEFHADSYSFVCGTFSHDEKSVLDEDGETAFQKIKLSEYGNSFQISSKRINLKSKPTEKPRLQMNGWPTRENVQHSLYGLMTTISFYLDYVCYIVAYGKYQEGQKIQDTTVKVKTCLGNGQSLVVEYTTPMTKMSAEENANQLFLMQLSLALSVGTKAAILGPCLVRKAQEELEKLKHNRLFWMTLSSSEKELLGLTHQKPKMIATASETKLPLCPLMLRHHSLYISIGNQDYRIVTREEITLFFRHLSNAIIHGLDDVDRLLNKDSAEDIMRYILKIPFDVELKLASCDYDDPAFRIAYVLNIKSDSAPNVAQNVENYLEAIFSYYETHDANPEITKLNCFYITCYLRAFCDQLKALNMEVIQRSYAAVTPYNCRAVIKALDSGITKLEQQVKAL